MAQAFQALGSKVTLVEGERRMLPLEEEFACVQIEAALQGYGVDVRTGQRAERFAQSAGTLTVTTADGATAHGDVLLVALGRSAPTDDLGVESVGLTPGDAVDVDAHMRVPGMSWLYAVGDINGRTLHTHMGNYQARLAADHILGHDHASPHGADGALSPRVVFADPQVVAVGHTTQTALQAGLVFDTYETETSGNLGGGIYDRHAPGTTRFLVDRDRRVLIGCTITGPDVADFLHAATIAIVGEIPLERLRHAVPPFPTRSEIWLALLEQARV
jgi:pyruvate/2-oxoglutarate dehydrogenase complex dihydrolipoamide dehydrogenase (E3) component